MAAEWVVLARLGKAHGIRGEVTAEGIGNSAERYQDLEQVHLVSRDAEPNLTVVELERVWDHLSTLVFKFRGIDSRNEAEALRNLDVCIPKEQRAPIPEGEYYHSDLIGCEVVSRDGRRLGEVTGWQEMGGPGLLQVQGEHEILIPFAKALCPEIDLEARRIVVDLPDGLVELNR